jgi:YVTN family beta-propeller protein
MNEVFVANYNSNTVSVISDNNNTFVATITVEKRSIGIAYDFGKNEIFVANSHYGDESGLGTVSVYPTTITRSYQP